MEDPGNQELGPDKNPSYLSRYEELRDESGAVLKLGMSSFKQHHSRLLTRHIEKDTKGFCRDPTPDSRGLPLSRYVVLMYPGRVSDGVA